MQPENAATRADCPHIAHGDFTLCEAERERRAALCRWCGHIEPIHMHGPDCPGRCREEGCRCQGFLKSDAATSRVCRQADDLGSYGIVLCNRFAGHEGQHEAVAYDHAWGPQEPTGKWVGEKWVRHDA